MCTPAHGLSSRLDRAKWWPVVVSDAEPVSEHGGGQEGHESHSNHLSEPGHGGSMDCALAMNASRWRSRARHDLLDGLVADPEAALGHRGGDRAKHQPR